MSGQATTVVQVGHVSGGMHLVSSPGRVGGDYVPRELPPDDPGFIGRAEQLRTLDDMLDHSDRSQAVVITSVSGTAGVGKTALAVHWGHRVAHRFPDGQLYVDLRGYDPDQPMPPAEALSGFLRTFGLSESAIPPTLEQRATRFRTFAANRRMLILLDNAKSAEQVRPLLPGHGGCFVLVTSRDAVPSLAIRHGARRIEIDLLTSAEAVDLLRTQLGPRVDVEVEAAAELIRQCARLPLALRMVSELAIARSGEKLAELTAELGDERQRLDVLDASGDARTALRAVFSWSYRNLPEDTARAFRLVGTHPGSDFDIGAVAALTGCTPAQGRGLVNLLHRARLIDVTSKARLRMHDLLRTYARSLASEMDSKDELTSAGERLFRYYLRGTGTALDLIAPQHGKHRPPWSDPPDIVTPVLAGQHDAISWLTMERDNLFLASGDDGSRVGGAAARHILGLVARHMGDIPQALHQFEYANLDLAAVPPGYRGRIWLDQAESLLAAGLAYEAARRLDDAVSLLDRATDQQDIGEAEVLRAVADLLLGRPISAGRSAVRAQRRFLRIGASTWAAIAGLVRLQANVRRAWAKRAATVSLAQRGLRLATRFAELHFSEESAVSRLLAVRVLLRTGRIADAENQLARTPKPPQFTAADHRMLRWLCEAELAAARGERALAREHVRGGLAEVADFRGRPGGLDPMNGTPHHLLELGWLDLRLMLRDNRSVDEPAEVFAHLERVRSRAHTHQLPIQDPVLADRVKDYRQLSHTLRLAQIGGYVPAKLARQHEALEQELTRWRGQTNLVSRSPAEFAAVAERLGDRALIAFLACRDRGLALVVVDGRAHLIPTGDRALVAETAWQLHADLNALAPDDLPPPVARVVVASAQARAHRLDEELLRPLNRLTGDRELVLIPDDPLFATAWGTLPSLQGRPVAVASSATAWLAADTAKRNQGRVALVRGPGLPPKTSEVNTLRGSYPHASVLEGRDATTASVLEHINGVELAHLACHGSHGVENALFSRLELADGPLFAHDVMQLPDCPTSVVLAANELGMSRARPGNEPLGFAGVLLSAGARTVIAAVTRIGDEATATAMADYHRRLSNGTPASHALAVVTATDPFRRPFVCVGSGR